MQPTSKPTSGYFGFFAENRLADHLAANPLTTDIFFKFWAEEWENMDPLGGLWKDWILTSLVTPFIFNYRSITFYQGLATFACLRGVGQRSCSFMRLNEYNCNSSVVTNQLVRSLALGLNMRTRCNGHTWSVNNSVLCINCPLRTNTVCPLFHHNYTMAVERRECNTGQYSPRVAMVVSVDADIVVASTVPAIDSISVTGSRYAIAVVVNASCFAPGCQFSCVALPQGADAPTLSTLRSSPFSTTLATMTNLPVGTRFRVNISQSLLPSTSYDVYCYAQDSLGNGATLKAALATLKTVSTACCRSVLFDTPTPSFLYKEAKTRSPFSFSLSSAPRVNVTVTVRVTVEDDLASTLVMTANPKSFVFLSTSSTLSGKFVLAIPATVAADVTYIINLDISGESGPIYTSVPTSLQVLSSSSAPPPPTLQSTRFDSNGASAVATFDSPSESVSPSGSTVWFCDAVLQFAGSNSSSCVWLTPESIRITFSATGSAAMVVGSAVTLRAAAVRARCNSAYFTATQCNDFSAAATATLALLGPSNPISPVAVLQAPRYLGVCDNLTLDATTTYGSGGRAWSSASFSVAVDSDVSADLSSIRALLSGMLDVTRVHTLPGRLFNFSTNYYFTVVVTTFLGGTGRASVAVMRNSTGLPQLAILGAASRTVAPADAVVLSAYAEPSPCGPAASSMALTYRWKVYKDLDYVGSVVSTSTNPRIMRLEPYTLASGHTYSFNCRVLTPAGDFAEATVRVYVAPGPLSAVIGGGSNRVSPADSALVLDASASRDQDAPASSAPALSFVWACSYLSDDSYGLPCNSSVLSGVNSLVGVLVVPANRLSVTDVYKFAVTVGSNGKVNSTEVVISVAPPGAPLVSTQPVATKINAGQRFTVTGTVLANSSLLSTWSLSSGGFALPLAEHALNAVSQVVREEQAKRGFPFALALRAGPFQPGVTYTFRLSASVPGLPSLAAYSELSFKINSPPSAGATAVTPAAGTYDTSFTISALRYVDDVSDYPITYRFAYRLKGASADKVSLLGGYTEQAYSVTSLPPGQASFDSAVICISFAQDVWGASANNSATATVTVPAGPALDASTLSGTVSSALSKSLSFGDLGALSKAVAFTSAVLNAIDCSGATNTACAALRRSPCSSVANTCGSCLTGFRGIVGAANSICRKPRASKATSRHLASVSVAESCLTDDDCNLGSCVNSICVPFMKDCPNQCSGHGVCVFMNLAGKAVGPCLASDPQCYPVCACTQGHGKADCSASQAQAESLDALRQSLCSALLSSALAQDKSADLLQSTAASLGSIFNAFEMSRPSSIASCGAVLTLLGTWAKEGLTVGNDASPQLLVTAVSQFVDISKVLRASAIRAENYSRFLNYSNPTIGTFRKLQTPLPYASLEQVLQNVVDGIHADMVADEAPRTYTSPNVRLTLHYSQVAAFPGASLVAPATEEEASYGTLMPSLTMPDTGFGPCGFTVTNFIYLSLLSWGFVPNSNALRLLAPPMRFTARLPTGQFAAEDAELYPAPSTLGLPASAGFRLFFPLYEQRTWVRYARAVNRTMPSCGFFADSEVLHCAINATRSPYSASNVTFAFADGSDLCPPSSDPLPRMNSAKRVLGSSSRLQFGAFDDIITKYPPYPVIYGASYEAAGFLAVLSACGLLGLALFVRWDYRDFGMAALYVSDRKLMAGSGAHHRRLRDKYGPLLHGLGEVLAALGPTDPPRDAALGALAKSPLMLTLDDPDKTSLSPPPSPPGKASLRINLFGDDHDHDHDDEGGGGWDGRDKLGEEAGEDKQDRGNWMAPVISLEAFDSSDEESEESGEDPIRDPGEAEEDVATEGAGVPSKPKHQPKHQHEHKSKSLNGPTSSGALGAPSSAASETDAETVDGESREAHADLLGLFQQALHLGHFAQHLGAVQRVASLVVEHHPTFKMLTPWRSFVRTRTSDYLNCFSRLLLALLLITAYYNVLYPANYSCERRIYKPFLPVNVTQRSFCLTAVSPVHNIYDGFGSECVWNKRGYNSSTCTRRPPPDLFLFYFLSAALVTLVAMAPNLLVRRLLRVCDKRPRLEDLGLDSLSWMGSPLTFSLSPQQHLGPHVTALGALFQKKHLEAVMCAESTNRSLRPTSTSFVIHTPKILGGPRQPVDLAVDVSVLTRARHAYYDVLSTKDEAALLAERARDYLRGQLQAQGPGADWMRRAELLLAALEGGWAGSVCGRLPLPLGRLLGWLGLGPRRQLERRLHRCRLAAAAVLTDVRSRQGTVSLHDDVQDIRLLQHWVLEQLPPVPRLAVRRAFAQANDEVLVLSADEGMHYVGLLEWLSSWACLLLIWGFALAWIIRWAAVNNQLSVNAWFITLAIVLAQDWLVLQTAEAYLIFVAGLELARPQLDKAQGLLCGIAVDKMTRAAPAEEEVRAVQHLSPACRAARSSALSHLAAAQLLMRIDDVDVARLLACASPASSAFSVSSPGVLLFAGLSRLLELLDSPWAQELFVGAMLLSIWTAVISAWYMLHHTLPRVFYGLVSAASLLLGACALWVVLGVLGIAPPRLFGWLPWCRGAPVSPLKSDDPADCPTSLTAEELVRRLADWDDAWRVPPASQGFNRRFWGSHDPRLQYVGGSTASLLQVHLEHTGRASACGPGLLRGRGPRPSVVCELDAALGLAASLFAEAVAGEGEQDRPLPSLGSIALVNVSSRLWRLYRLDGAFLSEREWLSAEAALQHDVARHAGRLTQRQFVAFVDDCVSSVRAARQEARDAAAASCLPPPLVGPPPIPALHRAERADLLLAPTNDPVVALRYLRARFVQTDVWSAGSLSFTELHQMAIWIWTVFHPDSLPLADRDRDVVVSLLFSMYPQQRARDFLSLPQFVAWFLHAQHVVARRRTGLSPIHLDVAASPSPSPSPRPRSPSARGHLSFVLPGSPEPIPSTSLYAAAEGRGVRGTRLTIDLGSSDEDDDEGSSVDVGRAAPEEEEQEEGWRIRKRANQALSLDVQLAPAALPSQASSKFEGRAFSRPAQAAPMARAPIDAHAAASHLRRLRVVLDSHDGDDDDDDDASNVDCRHGINMDDDDDDSLSEESVSSSSSSLPSLDLGLGQEQEQGQAVFVRRIGQRSSPIGSAARSFWK